MIPLCNFVDRSNREAPKGLILSSGGLTSPMRDVLATFTGQKLVDFRPRDCSEFIQGGPSYALQIADSHAGHPFVLENLNNPEQLAFDDNGWYTTKNTTYVFRLTPYADYATTTPNKIDQVNCDGKRSVMVAAIYLDSMPTSNFSPLTFGFIDTTDSNNYRHGVYMAYISSAHAIRRANGDGVLKTLGAGDVGKWHLLVAVKEGTTITHRWLGGATASLGTNAAGPAYPSSDPRLTDRLQIPINSYGRVGLIQVANYTGNNDAGVAGTAQGDLDYTLFEPEHVCGDYDDPGRTIIFSCTGQVAFEVYTHRGWSNTDGSSGSANRVWYDTGSFEVRCAAPFTRLRPVLKNSGLLNADTRGVLTSCRVRDDVSRRGRGSVRAPLRRVRR